VKPITCNPLGVVGPEGQHQEGTLKNKFLILLSILAVMCWAMVAFPPGAQATVTLFLNDNVGDTVTIADGSAGDANPASGAVTFIGALGVWNINVSTGVSGSPVPSLDLNSIDVSTAAGHLTIMLSDTEFTTVSPTTVFEQIGGTTAGTVNFSGYSSSSNGLFAETTLINTFTGLGPAGFSGNFQDTFNTASPFSLTEVIDVWHTGAGTTSFDALVATPVPPTALLLGTGLLGLVGLGWRRKRS
jgi:hypothetical protein